MPLTPLHVTYLARFASILLLSVLVLLNFMHPYRGALQSAPFLLPACFVVTYITAIAAYVALPRTRRGDVSLVIFAIVTAAPACQLAFSQGCNYGAWAANVSGIVAAFLPGQIEQLRRLQRHQRFISFSELARNDRRRAKLATKQPQPQHQQPRYHPLQIVSLPSSR